MKYVARPFPPAAPIADIRRARAGFRLLRSHAMVSPLIGASVQAGRKSPRRN